jgi:hypothetical protein
MGRVGWGVGAQAEIIHPAARIHNIQFLNMATPFIDMEEKRLAGLTFTR